MFFLSMYSENIYLCVFRWGFLFAALKTFKEEKKSFNFGGSETLILYIRRVTVNVFKQECWFSSLNVH